MKKNIFLVLFICFGFASVTNAAMPSFSECTESNGVTTLPTAGQSSSAMCSTQPDTYKLTIYELNLCTSAITAPTTSSAAVTTSCQTVLSNTNPSATTITKGSNASISGTMTRPPNGTYTHGYALLSNVLSISDSRQFNASVDDSDADTTADGVYCATTTTAGASECGSSAVTAGEQEMKLGQTHFGSNYTAGEQTISGYGTMNAWLVDTDKKLEADTDGDVVYMVGQMAFTTPVVVTDNTSTFKVDIDVSNGLLIMHMDQTSGGGNSDKYVPYAGPFKMRMSVE